MPPASRERIITATALVAVEHGCDALSVQHILTAANVSRRTFYKQFGSKDEALRAVYTGLVNTLIERMGAGLDAVDPTHRISGAIEAFLDVQQSGGPIVITLQGEANRRGSLLAPERSRALDELVKLVDTAVQKTAGISVDTHVYLGLLIAFEGLVLYEADDGTLTNQSRDRIRAVMTALFGRVLGIPVRLPRDRMEETDKSSNLD